jgi:hypothetical protein
MRRRRLTPAARAVQCCVWILSVLGPASLVLGFVLLVRLRRLVRAAAWAMRGVWGCRVLQRVR